MIPIADTATLPAACDIARHHTLSSAWEDGYRAGFEAGADVGGAEVLLAVTRYLPADLADVPHRGQYEELQQRRAAGPCGVPRCGACGARRDAVVRNRQRYGQDDYPGRMALQRGAS